MIAVSASICIMLHQQYDCTDDEARARMKQEIDDLTRPLMALMAEAKARGMKVEAYVEQLTSQEE